MAQSFPQSTIATPGEMQSVGRFVGAAAEATQFDWNNQSSQSQQIAEQLGLAAATPLPEGQIGGATQTFLITINADGTIASLQPIQIQAQPFNALYNFASSMTWNVTHGLGLYPNVVCVNSAGLVLTPATITYNSVNALTVTFAAPTAGGVILT